MIRQDTIRELIKYRLPNESLNDWFERQDCFTKVEIARIQVIDNVTRVNQGLPTRCIMDSLTGKQLEGR